MALLLAVSLMAVTILFGLASIEGTMAWTAAEERAAERGSARAIAEGGVDYLQHYLETQPRSGSRTLQFEGWQIRLQTDLQSEVAHTQSVVSRNGVSQGYEAESEVIRRTLPSGVSIKVGASVDLGQDSSLTWSGTLQFQDTPSADPSATHRGSWEPSPSFTSLTPNFGRYATLSDVIVHRDGVVLAGQAYSGRHYSAGDVTFAGPGVYLDGSLAAVGDVTVDALGGDVTLTSKGDDVVLIAGGDIIFRNVGQLKISGMILGGGDLILENVVAAELFGAVGIEQDLKLDRATLSLEYNVELSDYRVPYVSGGDGETTVSETWRRPFTP